MGSLQGVWQADFYKAGKRLPKLGRDGMWDGS